MILCLVTVCLLLASCGKQPASAYDLAVKNGFVGTEEQWLASLNGQNLRIEDIFARAVQEGYTGSFLDFLTDYLSVDPAMLSDAIYSYQARDTAQMVANSLLASVSVQCQTSGTTTGVSPTAGSGVIYSLVKNEGNAYIITNFHVVSYDTGDGNAIYQSIFVFLYGAQRTSENAIKATYIGGSATHDLAVLKVSGSELLKNSSAVPIAAADSDLIAAGQDAIAIGNAAGKGISVTRGIISIESKEVELSSDGKSRRLIQVDTPINEGNSGGGLFDRNGNLIGIVTAKVEAEGVENIGYAIPANVATRIAQSLIESFEAQALGDFIFEKNAVNLKVAEIGVTLSSANARAVWDAESEITRLTEDVTVDSISALSPAKAAGLKNGDVITAIKVDDTEISVTRAFSVTDAMLLCRAGSTVTITYLRGTAEGSATFTVSASHFKTVI